ncbi:hypothetical protein ATANTOWER_028142 [Ataeniobius toweri]|uniref:Peptidase A2 domain-containing protein n=1 Tax=Ataeniobius toweri TaxID=208326 RepID=A0ABU7BTH7_9TELE|nr:hypothetical protein [Ataeniobius toweri]
MTARKCQVKLVMRAEATIASRQCPAKGKQCLKFRKYNHFAKTCRSKTHYPQKTGHRELNFVGEAQDDYESELFVDTVMAAEEDEEDSAYADIALGPENAKLTLKLDTGAQASVMPIKDFVGLSPTHH